MKRLASHIALAASRPAPLLAAAAFLLLAACGQSGDPKEPPVSKTALAAVVANPGSPRVPLARAVDALFNADGIGETDAVVIMHAGEIVAERYGDGYGPKTRFLGWSLSKTVTGLVIGMLVSDGRLHIDESPPIPHWRRPGDPRGEITLKQLLQMRSGLRHTETTEAPYASDPARLLFLDGRDNMAMEAEAAPLEAEPGRKFEYSTATSIILADIATRVLTHSEDPVRRQRVMSEFLAARLFGPLGLRSMVAEYDAAGTMIGGAMISANARDWARLGEFLRNGGSVKGAQILPRGWIDFMRHPSPRAPDYGAQLWLNRPSGTDRNVLFASQGPKSAFAAIGHLGQYVIVSPAQKLTIVRLGKTREEDRPALVARLAEISALYPAG
jgi:CubicO group peptidase (beta-lactamase class C family)